MSDNATALAAAALVALGGWGVSRQAATETPVALPSSAQPVNPALPVQPPARTGELLVFGQPNCPPCERLKTSLARANLAGLGVRHIDVRADPASAGRYQVRSTPTLVRLDAAGKEVGRKVGYQTARQINDFVR